MQEYMFYSFLGVCWTMPFLGVFAYRPALCYFQKINTCNINYMAVLDFLKMPLSEKNVYSPTVS